MAGLMAFEVVGGSTITTTVGLGIVGGKVTRAIGQVGTTVIIGTEDRGDTGGLHRPMSG